MLTFLQIVLAVVLVALISLMLGWTLLKRWLRRRLGDYRLYAELIGDRYAAPARLQLQPAQDCAAEPELLQRWQQAHALGFRELADFSARNGDPELLRAAEHTDLPIALALSQHDGDVHFALFALADDQRLCAYSSGPGSSALDGTLDWTVDAQLDLPTALVRLQQATAGRDLRRLDAALFRRVIERAYARRRDRELSLPPRRDDIVARAAQLGRKLSDAQIDGAQAMAMSQWQELISEAALQQFQETSRISASDWERQRDDVQVVHRHLSSDDVRDMLAHDPASQSLWQQLSAQHLTGSDLYRQLNQRLPAAQQRQLLGEVRSPLPALIFARNDEPGTVSAAVVRQHHYEALDAQGRPVAGAVLASTSADAKRQIAGLGLTDSKILIESGRLDEQPDFMFDPELAAIAARSAREGLGTGLLRALLGNWLLWLPPALLLAWSLAEGAPYGWGDHAIFLYAGVALLLLGVFVAPMLLYNQLLQSRLHARWRSAKFCLALLSRLNLIGAIPPHHLQLERCKILVGQGRIDDALSLWAQQQALLSEEQYLTGLVQLHDSQGNAEATIATQRRLLELSPQEMIRVDLAMSLARHAEQADAAEDLLAAIDPSQLSELALAGYHFARGLVLGRRGQFGLAIRQFSEAVAKASQYKSNPLVLGMLAEINGYAAVMLKRSGDHARADELWRQVRPLLQKHPSCRQVLASYETT